MDQKTVLRTALHFQLRTLCVWALVLTVAATPAYAGKLHLVINGKSFHVNSDYDWNESNYGIGVEYEFSSHSRWSKVAMANGFRDSQNNISYMAGAGLHRRLFATERFANLYVDAGINLFLMARRGADDYQPFPGLLPSLTLGNRYGGINLSYVPKRAVHNFSEADTVDPNIDGVFFLQFKIRLDNQLRR